MIDLGREVVNNAQSVVEREWLVTNGMGGFASGTVAGVLTRRYHGLLVAALRPPLGRTLMAVKIDDTATYDGTSYVLYANSWAPDSVYNRGFLYLDSFRLDGTTPVWTYALGDALIEKRIWMQQGANTTYIQYRCIHAGEPLTLEAKWICDYRDYHGTTRSNNHDFTVQSVAHGLCVQAYDAVTPYYLLCADASAEPQAAWYRNFFLAQEAYRGLPEREDHYYAGRFTVELAPGGQVTLVATTDPAADLDGPSQYAAQKAHEEQLLELASPLWAQASPDALRELPNARDTLRQLVLAADQFIVQRPLSDAGGVSVIAGYPWFGDWGRDTMIALPGLTLTPGRPEMARDILRTFAQFVDDGMLPNRFPDSGEQPEYNTVDATLWYFEALRAYHAATDDGELVAELLPVLAEIIAWHQRGTRYNIKVTPHDNLLYAGVEGVQLTWMDAKAGDWVVTPRIGKPVEINALWYNALRIMETFAAAHGRDAAPYRTAADRVRHGFDRFWNKNTGYLFDVIEGPRGNEASLRPNQIFAVSLPHSPLNAVRQKAVVTACTRHLFTPHGLRSLADFEPEYVGVYGGDVHKRDGSYHQGTVWGWLIGPFVAAHLRVYGNPPLARSYLHALMRQISSHCVGSLSEIFDGDVPFTPRGAFAQAWTVAEVLRAWQMTAGAT